MPAYFITLHAYRSWSEDRPEGYFQHGKHGVQPPNPNLSIHRSRSANQPPRRFTPVQQQLIITHASEIVGRRDIRLHAASCTPTHVHLIVSWFGKEALIANITTPLNQAKAIAAKTKNILATLLSKQEGTTGNHWFSHGCDCTPVEDREHLNHLIESYLPKHRAEGGIVKIFDKGDTTP